MTPAEMIAELQKCIRVRHGDTVLSLSTLPNARIAMRIAAAIDMIDRLASENERLRTDVSEYPVYDSDRKGCDSP